MATNHAEMFDASMTLRSTRLSRRQFVRLSVEASGSLLIALTAAPLAAAHSHATGEDAQRSVLAPNGWVRVHPSGEITLLWSKSEMGQGVSTALPMIVAEELDVDWKRVRTERAATTDAFDTETGGSSSVRESWHELRTAGAVARAVFLAAAARRWNVAESGCATENGEVVHMASGRRLAYGNLIDQAATIPVPDPAKVALKDPRTFRLVGSHVPRSDCPEKVSGHAGFGIDVRLPGMLIASVARCPTFNGRVARVEDSRARAVRGVRDVVQLGAVPSLLPGRVAVLADSMWAATQGRLALGIEWDHGGSPLFATEQMWRAARASIDADDRARVVVRQGEGWSVPPGMRLVERVYTVPFAAHACMEPMNCTAHVRSDRVDIWAPTQFPRGARKEAAELTGLPEANVTVNVTFLGGGFGRRAYQDFVVEAVELSRRAGAPVKVIWTREDDIQHDFYRPAALERFRAVLDNHGRPIRWHNRTADVSWERWWNPSTDEPEKNNGGDRPPYDIANLLIDYVELPGGIPIGAWRSVRHSQNGFCLESFVDECAVAAGQDPLRYRLMLLEGKPRQQTVLRVAAERASWGKPLPRGRGRGVAFWDYAGTYVAQVAEVTVDSSGAVKVDRVVCGFDCGTVVNPDTVRAQVESAIVWGVNAALWSEITVVEGRAQQSNFHDYRVMRMSESPTIEVELIRNFEPPTGVGEPGVPPVAAAVANAVFAATGERRRELPLNRRANGAGHSQ